MATAPKPRPLEPVTPLSPPFKHGPKKVGTVKAPRKSIKQNSASTSVFPNPSPPVAQGSVDAADAMGKFYLSLGSQMAKLHAIGALPSVNESLDAEGLRALAGTKKAMHNVTNEGIIRMHEERKEALKFKDLKPMREYLAPGQMTAASTAIVTMQTIDWYWLGSESGTKLPSHDQRQDAIASELNVQKGIFMDQLLGLTFQIRGLQSVTFHGIEVLTPRLLSDFIRLCPHVTTIHV